MISAILAILKRISDMSQLKKHAEKHPFSLELQNMNTVFVFISDIGKNENGILISNSHTHWVRFGHDFWHRLIIIILELIYSFYSMQHVTSEFEKRERERAY